MNCDEISVRYVVTKASDDGTFEVGDHIKFLENGSILCVEAEGWIDKEYVEKASKGMEYELDKDYIRWLKADLIQQLAKLEKFELED